jgi:hypothetical protein
MEVEVRMLGPDVTDPTTKKVTPGTGTAVETFRLRPVTDAERAKARREASTGRQQASVDKEGTRSVSLELNAELYNTAYLFYALGGDKVFGSGEHKEGWTLKTAGGDPLPLSLDTLRANLHPGLVAKLVDIALELGNISPASEKN